MLDAFAVASYRSLRDVVLPLASLNVVTGSNGSGKSNLYRALRLLVDIAHDRAVGSLAREGGLASVMWAGPEEVSSRMRRGEVPVQGTVRKHRSVLRIGFVGEDVGYSAELGLPAPERPPSDRPTLFALDPEVKRESIWSGPCWSRRAALIERTHGLVQARDSSGAWTPVTTEIAAHESMLTWTAHPGTAPEVVRTRYRIQGWRFYDQFRCDRDAPARRLQIGTRTPALAHDGRDLAAAIETILEIGDAEALAESLDEAFPGARLDVSEIDGRFQLQLFEKGLLRPLGQQELSDGTLRYLLWLAALHTPRPPELMVLNEPETSLHGDLLEPLARLVVRAAKRSQVVVVSHSPILVAALREHAECNVIALRKRLGETMVELTEDRDRPTWMWPKR